MKKRASSATPDGLIVGLPRDCLLGFGIEDCLADSVLVECKTARPPDAPAQAPAASRVPGADGDGVG